MVYLPVLVAAVLAKLNKIDLETMCTPSALSKGYFVVHIFAHGIGKLG
jgi:hypothetical protein